MDSFEDIVKSLKKKPGASFGFAVAESSDKSPIKIIADKKKSGKSLQARAKKLGALIASGDVSLSDDNTELNFSCDFLKSGFRESALKPYFSKLTVKPAIMQAAAGASEDGQDDDDDADDDAQARPDETLVTLWSKSYAKTLETEGIPKDVLDGINGMDRPVELRLPKYFIRALKEHSAEAYAARIVDKVNTLFDASAQKMKSQIEANQADPQKPIQLNREVQDFEQKSEALVETAWDGFVSRYEVTKGFKRKRFKAVAVPIVGGIAAVAGTAGSIATGNVAGGIAGSIAAFRATCALITAWRQYARELGDILKTMETALKRLAQTYIDSKTKVAEHARETGLVVLNSLSGGALAPTFKSVKDTIDVFKPRLALAERNLDETMKEANQAIKLNTRQIAGYMKFKATVAPLAKQGNREAADGLKWVNQIIDASNEAGKQVTALLDKIASGNKEYETMGQKVTDLEKIIDVLNKGTALTMEKTEKVMTFIVNAVATAANLSVGIATASSALDGVITGIGAVTDNIDMISAEWDALDAVFG